jgi:hypothetical protein
MGEVGPVVLGDRYGKLVGSEAWTAFLFAICIFGHVDFLLGSWLDEFYDWARRFTLNTRITLLARHGYLLPWPARALIWLVFKRERNLAPWTAPARSRGRHLAPPRANPSVPHEWMGIGAHRLRCGDAH